MPNIKTYKAKAIYSFATNGGAVSAITPDVNTIIPNGALITGASTHVTTNMTSGGAATLALAVGGVTILAATAYNDAALTGFDAISVTGKTTSDARIVFTIAGAALTAGVVEVYVDYFMPNE